jgi:hypothetical protein
MDNYSVIDNFISSNEVTLNLGILNYFQRRDIGAYCHKLRIHTLSINSNPENQYLTDEQNLKQLLISKEPFPVTDFETECSIINELSFLLNMKIFLTKSSLNDVLAMSDDKTKNIIKKFLFQFSLEFSNNYPRLFRHRISITKIIGDKLSEINIPTVEKYKFKCKQLHIDDNHGKKFVRFDMINAVSSVIGIKDWSTFMSNYTSIELYCNSKPLRGKIMTKIHQQCMRIVETRTLALSQKLNCIALNSDEIVIEYDPKTDYSKLKQEIDPNNDYKMSIFVLEHLTDRYIEKYDDGTIKYKCLQQRIVK